MSAFEDIKTGLEQAIAYERGEINPRHIYKTYKLNLDKVNSVDDCKKILKFLCDMYLQPIPIDCEYNGFGDIAEYFER